MRLSATKTCAPLLLACASLASACASPAATGLPSTAEADIVIGTGFPIESSSLGQTRRINVQLPAGYAQRSDSFPVVYLIDGGVEQDFIPVAGFGALATLSGQFEEFILVGVETRDRRYELTTPSSVAYDLENIPDNGGAAAFRRFVVNEVRPWIERRYRTTGEAAVLGESLAGFFIVDTFLRAPESFDHYIAVSPSVWWNAERLVRAAATYLEADRFPADRSLYLTVADEEDIRAGLVHLVSALEEHPPAGLTWWFEPLPEEHHDSIYHPATLSALRRVFGTRAAE